MIEKQIIAQLHQFLADNRFSRLGKANAWLRKTPEINQYVRISTTSGGNIRLITLVFPNNEEEKTVLGGNLTQSSIGSSATLGGDFVWVNSSDSINSIIKSMKFVAIPWFNSLQNLSSFKKAVVLHVSSMSFAPPSEIFEKEAESIKIVEATVPSQKRLSSEEFDSEVLSKLAPRFEEFGFRKASSGDAIFYRKRGDIYDVLLLELINYGVHFGAYAYNWVSELAIDGAQEVTRDNSFMMNGGVVTSQGIATNLEESFLVSDTNRFVDAVLENVLPTLEKVKSKEDFKSSIKPEMQSMAKLLLG